MGDLNGDEVGEMAIATSSVDDENIKTHVVLSENNGTSSEIDLDNPDSDNGFVFSGIDPDSISKIRRIEDINGDKVDEIIVEVSDVNNETKEIYTILSNENSFPRELDLSTLDGIDGFKITGIEQDSTIKIRRIEDINGDEIDEIIVEVSNVNGETEETYAIFSNEKSFPHELDLSTLDGIDGFKIIAPDLDSESDSDNRLGANNRTDNLITEETSVDENEQPVAEDKDESTTIENMTNITGPMPEEMFPNENQSNITSPDSNEIILDESSGVNEGTLEPIEDGGNEVVGNNSEDVPDTVDGDEIIEENEQSVADGNEQPVAEETSVDNEKPLAEDVRDTVEEEPLAENIFEYDDSISNGNMFNFTSPAPDETSVSGNELPVATYAPVNEPIFIEDSTPEETLTTTIEGDGEVATIEETTLEETLITVEGSEETTVDEPIFTEETTPEETLTTTTEEDIAEDYSEAELSTEDTLAEEHTEDSEPIMTEEDLLLIGGVGDDTIIGDSGNDLIIAGEDNDLVRGKGGSDRIFGNQGNDTLTGNFGDDEIFGNDGDDLLIGGQGNDTLIGGEGEDIFIFDTNSIFDSWHLGVDRIRDFTVGEDKILLIINTFEALEDIDDGRLQNSDLAIISDNTLANGSSAKIIYNSDSGNLSYDPDSTGEFIDENIFARLIGSPDNLSTEDFQIIDDEDRSHG